VTDPGPIHIEVQPRYRDVLAGRPRTATVPLPDELLSSWIARLADHNGLVPRELASKLGLGTGMAWAQVDVAPAPHVVAALAELSGLPERRIADMALPEEYRSTLVLAARDGPSGSQAAWVQFCPDCWGQEAVPYLRRDWRLASTAHCHDHRRTLHDRCSKCHAAIAGLDQRWLAPLHSCGQCGRDLKNRGLSGIDSGRGPRVADQVIAAFLREERVRGLLTQSGLLRVLHRLPRSVLDKGRAAAPLRSLSTRRRVEVLSLAASRFSAIFAATDCGEALERRTRIVRDLRPIEADSLRLEGDAFGPFRHPMRGARRDHLPALLRAGADMLGGRPRVGREVFVRGAPEDFPDPRKSVPVVSLMDLLTSYAGVARKREAPR